MSNLIFRVLTGVITVWAVTAMESQVVTRLFGPAIAAVSAAIGS